MKTKILIYDDDADILFLSKTILSKHGFEVTTRTRCEDILNELKSFQPHIVLMDLSIPTDGGEKHVQIAKQNPDTRKLPVLIFSARRELQSICERIEADGWIEKPFEIQTLVDVIKSHIPDGVN